MSEPVLCSHCSDVIGIYEPMIVVDRDGIHRTALAAHPEGAGEGEARYHRACFEQRRSASAGAAA